MQLYTGHWLATLNLTWERRRSSRSLRSEKSRAAPRPASSGGPRPKFSFFQTFCMVPGIAVIVLRGPQWVARWLARSLTLGGEHFGEDLAAHHGTIGR